MILLSLEVENFRAVRAARLMFARGLNVLYGPNDLGKSTLVEAIRVAFLLSHQSKACDDLKPWGTDRIPRVVVEFELNGTVWRIDKEFANARGSALLQQKGDGEDWREIATGRAVEGKLREIIAWGIPGPGGKGAPKGLPESYLATALLGGQDSVTKILWASPEDDGADHGRKLIAQALDAIGQDPLVGAVLNRLQEDVNLVFTNTGQLRRTADSPIEELRKQLDTKRDVLKNLQDSVRTSQGIETEIRKLREKEINLKRRVDLLLQVKAATETVEKIRQHENALAQARRELEQANSEMFAAEAQFQRSDNAKRQTEQDLRRACEKRDKLAGALEARKRDQQQARDNRKQELELKRRNTIQDKEKATAAKRTEAQVADGAREVQRLEEESKLAKRYESHTGAFVALAELMTVRQQALSLREAMNCAAAAEADTKRAEVTLADVKGIHETATAETAAISTRIAGYENRIGSLRIKEREALQHIGRINAAVDVAARLEEATQVLRQLEVESQELETRLDNNTEEREACERRRQTPFPWPILPALLAGAACAGLAIAFGFALSFSLPLLVVASPIVFAIASAATAIFLRQRKQQQAVAIIEREIEALDKARAKLLEKRNLLAAKLPGMQSHVDSAKHAIARADVPNFNRANANADLERLQSELEGTRTELAQVQDKLARAKTAEPVDTNKLKRDIEAAQAVVEQTRRERDHMNTARITAQEQFKIALRTLDTEQSSQLYVGLLGIGDGSAAEPMTPFDLQTELEKLAIEREEKLPVILAVAINGSEAALWQTLDPTELGQAPAGIDRMPEEYRFFTRIYRQIEIVLHHTTKARVSPTPELARQIESLRQQLRDALKPGGREMATVSARHLLEALQRLKTLFAQRGGVELDLSLAKEGFSSAKSAAESAKSSLKASPDDILREAEKTLQDVDQKLANLDAECDAELTAATTEAAAARTEAERLQGEHEQAVQAHDAATEERDRVRQRRDDVARLFNELGNIAFATSLPDAMAAFERVRTSYAVESSGASLPDASAEMEARLKREEAELRAVTDKLTEKRGELNHVGGIVFRERRDREQEAYDRLVERAKDLESEYRAKLHLFNTLKCEEGKQSTHLGRILAGPVSAIFAALTADRYPQLVLDPGLRFQSVVAMGGERQVQALSVGTRDQLATLVRLALAAHLRIALVLDDQLTQSDARVMCWFRERIRASVRDRGHQVVVVTCHPEHYLDPTEMPVPPDDCLTAPDGMLAATNLTCRLTPVS